MWHNRLDHPHSSIVYSVLSTMNKSLNSNSTLDLCSTCHLSKSHRLPLTHVHVRSNKPFDIIHNHLWVPSLVVFMHHRKYFLFVDLCYV